MDLTRTIHAETLAALQSGAFHPAVLVWLDWPDAPLRVHSGRGDLSWGGETWAGVMVGERSFGAVDVGEEAGGLVPAAATLSLVLPDDAVQGVLAAPIRNRPGALYLAVTTERGGNVLVGEPVEIFAGYMDAIGETLQETDEGFANVVRLTLGSGPPPRAGATVVHSYESQSAAQPGDTAGRLLINSLNRARRIRI